jgi:hypothetical protein
MQLVAFQMLLVQAHTSFAQLLQAKTTPTPPTLTMHAKLKLPLLPLSVASAQLTPKSLVEPVLEEPLVVVLVVAVPPEVQAVPLEAKSMQPPHPCKHLLPLCWQCWPSAVLQ